MLSKSMQYSLMICNYGDEDDDEGEDNAVDNDSGKFRFNPISPLSGDP